LLLIFCSAQGQGLLNILLPAKNLYQLHWRRTLVHFLFYSAKKEKPKSRTTNGWQVKNLILHSRIKMFY